MYNKASMFGGKWLAYSAFGLAIGASGAMAQQSSDVLVQADRPQIAVKMPVRGSVVKEISLAQHVSYADLDLATAAGRAELKRRVTLAAEAVCSKLDKVYPGSTPKGETCAAISVKNAMQKVSPPSAGAVG